MMRTTRTAGALVTGLLVAAALTLPVFAVADSSSVTVTFRVNPTVSAEIVDGGLLVRSNAPWQLMATVAGPNSEVLTITEKGSATGAAGVLVQVGELVDYSLVLDTTY